MKTAQRYSRLFLWVLSLVVMLSFWFLRTLNVSAETTMVNVTIESGTLHFTTIPNDVTFSNIKLTGQADKASQSLIPLKVTDARGTGKGWSVEVSATPFAETSSSLALDPGSLKIKKPVAFTSEFVGSIPPTSNYLGSDPYSIDGGSSVKIVKASDNSGLGPWTISWDSDSLSLTLNPATTRIGTYVSTITWQLNDVPE